jgi:hypothetical protein
VQDSDGKAEGLAGEEEAPGELAGCVDSRVA